MKTIEKHKFLKKIASNNKRKQLISKNLKVDNSYDYKKKKFNNCNNKNRK